MPFRRPLTRPGNSRRKASKRPDAAESGASDRRRNRYARIRRRARAAQGRAARPSSTPEYQLVIIWWRSPARWRRSSGSMPPCRRTGTSPIAGSSDSLSGSIRRLSPGARAKIAELLVAPPFGKRPLALLGKFGKFFTDFFARLAAVENEAPGRQTAMVGHPACDGQSSSRCPNRSEPARSNSWIGAELGSSRKSMMGEAIRMSPGFFGLKRSGATPPKKDFGKESNAGAYSVLQDARP